MEIADVVGDDKRGGCGHCEFEDKIVVRVWKEWPPCEKHLLVVGEKTKAVHDFPDVPGRERGNETRPQQNRLIFKNKRNGHGNPDIPGAYRPEYLETGSPIGSESRHKH